MGQFTVSVMMRSASLASWDDFWSLYDGSNHAYLETNASDSLSVFGSPAYQDDGNLGSTVNIEDGQWHWLAITADQSTDTSRMYIDGTLVDTTDWNYTGTATQFQLTSRLFDGTRALVADIDEFRIYDEVLTQPAIAALMVGSVVPEPSTLALCGAFGLFLWGARRRLR